MSAKINQLKLSLVSKFHKAKLIFKKKHQKTSVGLSVVEIIKTRIGHAKFSRIKTRIDHAGSEGLHGYQPGDPPTKKET